MAKDSLPGLNIGPLDPDKSDDFGAVDGKTNARALIRHHSELYPPDLVGVLARPLNEERSKALDRGEVAELLDGKLPEGAVFAGAQVRGSEDADKFLTFTFRSKAGRTQKGFVPYDSGGLDSSHERGDKAVEIRELKAAGLPWSVNADPQSGGDGASTRERRLQRKVDEQQRQIDELTNAVSHVGAPVLADVVPAGVAESDHAAASGPAAPEPYEGYDEATASQIVNTLQDEATTDETAQAVLAYELSHARRKTVVTAAEHHGASRDKS